MPWTRADQSEVVEGTPQDCYEAILQFETYPEWQSAVKEVAVLERDEEGRGRVVEFKIDAKVKAVRYVLRYHYEPYERVWWTYVEGDMRDVEGDLVFERLDDGRTKATYRLGIDPGSFVPSPIRKALTAGIMRTVVRELRQRVEQPS